MSAHQPAPSHGVSPLPEHPDLEYERKRARKMLRELRSARPDAKLADVQFAIAREYGFSSWPKLVAYYQTWWQHHLVHPVPSAHSIDTYQRRVDDFARMHRAGHWRVAATLATYVPRLYGATDDEVFAAQLSLDEFRLAVAREAGFGSWSGLVGEAARGGPEPDADDASPIRRYHAAIRAQELMPDGSIRYRQPLFAEARTLVEEHALLRGEFAEPVIAAALSRERDGDPGAREFVDWLVSLGADPRPAASRMLRGFKTSPDAIRRLLDRGADPAFEGPGEPPFSHPGQPPLLEHALLRYWNGAAVDLILPHVEPRKALWIAAGTGDTAAVRRYFGRDGRLLPSARRYRPDFTLVRLPTPCRPGVDDREIIWEAFFVAAFNGRGSAMDVLLAHGHDIDYSPWRSNALHLAVGNRLVETVELLAARGANMDLRGYMPDSTPREAAAENLRDHPDDPAVRRIAAVLGVLPESSTQ